MKRGDRQALNPIAERFGENLRHCRNRAEVSQDDLSRSSSLHRTEISQLERGLRVPRIDTVVKLRDALEVSSDDLLDGITWRAGTYRPGGYWKWSDPEGG